MALRSAHMKVSMNMKVVKFDLYNVWNGNGYNLRKTATSISHDIDITIYVALFVFLHMVIVSKHQYWFNINAYDANK